MSDVPAPEHWYTALFRGFIGVAAIAGSLAALAGLYFIAVPAGNKDPLLLAIGIILGWGSSVVSSEYGSTSTGRKVVDQAVKNLERTQATADSNAQLATVPDNVVEAAQDTAKAAQTKADQIEAKAK